MSMTSPEKQGIVAKRHASEGMTSRIADWISLRFDDSTAKPALRNIVDDYLAYQIKRQLHRVYRKFRAAKASKTGSHPGSPLSLPPMLDPLGAPCRSLERICEILCFVDYFAVPELHDADRETRPVEVRDCIFSDP
jgi:hypothetical protein